MPRHIFVSPMKMDVPAVASDKQLPHDRGILLTSDAALDSVASSESEERPPHPHHLKLLALSAELMRPPFGRTSKDSTAKSMGLVEEARNRRRGRKEKCVHWDRVEIDGREFPLQRADIHITPAAPTAALAGKDAGKCDPLSESNPSYLLVGHSTCDMCLMTFESTSVSGVITMKRVLEARQSWGLTTPGAKKFSAASNLYEPARLCALCRQFFCARDGGDGHNGDITARGVGRSETRVSLTLESMASNKPLPDKTSRAAANETTRRAHRRRSANKCQLSGFRHGTGGDAAANFRLDELIADNRLVVEETDLAQLPQSIASQSSTADGMTAIVCTGALALASSHRGQEEQAGPEVRRVSWSKTQHHEVAALQLRTPGDARTPSTADGTNRGLPAHKRFMIPAPDEGSGNLSTDESAAAAAAAARLCSRTRRESQPWWEVYLEGVFPIRCIRVRHPDRRTEATKAGALPFVDVAPFWIMTAAGPIGNATSEEAVESALATKRIVSHGKVTLWDLGVNHFASTVRIQAEGVKSLQLARVEVIKGGGTRQAMDVLRQQMVARESSLLHQDSTDGSSCPQASALPYARAERGHVVEGCPRPLGVQGAHKGGSRGGTRPSGKPNSQSSIPFDTGAANPLTRAAAGVPATEFVGTGSATYEPGVLPSELEANHTRSRDPHSREGAVGTNASSTDPGSGSFRCSASRRRRRRRLSRQGEDVRGLLLRTMVGYDWVDDFNGQELRVRGAFTESDVAILEEIFLRCALGDDTEARATASVADQSLQVDPGNLCGDLRRLQLQVQTNTSGKNKAPMLVAVRESSHLSQLFSSGVVESLSDALARAEAQLPPQRQPLYLEWTRFLGVMGLCLEGAYQGSAAVAASAVARLFEETHDDKLDFLTRKRSRLPPTISRKSPDMSLCPGGASTPAVGGPGGGGGEGGSCVGACRRAATAPADAGVLVKAGEGSSLSATRSATAGGLTFCAEELFLRGGASVDTSEDGVEHLTELGSGSAGRHREESLATTRRGNAGAARGGRSGWATALKSLLRPQARHQVSRAYGEAMSNRREKQREAFNRTPGPDLEPTRVYKPCGLCQAPFPVECLMASVSLKVVGAFLARVGAPSERFERKASSLCGLHRLLLCVFCDQFFDPVFPSGIVPPGGYDARRRGKRRLPTNTNALVPFFDDRHPDRCTEAPPPSSAPSSSSRCTRTPHDVESVAGVPVSSGGVMERTSSARVGSSAHVLEAKELREVGRLVRGGCSIRDRLLDAQPSLHKE